MIWSVRFLIFCSNIFQGKFKRLKKAQRHGVGEPGEFSDEEEFDGSGKGGRTAEEKLERSLFGHDEGISVYACVELNL